MNGEKDIKIEGYRKFIIGIVSVALSMAGLFGVSIVTQNAIAGIAASIVPLLANLLFNVYNEREKKIEQTPKVETPEQGEVKTFSSVGTLIEDLDSEPVRLPPNVDTMPPFDASDGELNNAQLDLIRAWYMKPVTDKPSLPDVSVGTPNRVMTAQNEIAMEALTVFPGSLADEVLRLRKDCSEKIWMRINFHSAEARRRWINYGLALWAYREGVALI